jgi:hypothetical protein
MIPSPNQLQRVRIERLAKSMLGEVQIRFVTSGSWLSFEIVSPKGGRLALGMTTLDGIERKSDTEIENWLNVLLGGYRVRPAAA